MLELVHLTKVFGDCVACADVSLEVGEGEVVAVVGENGAGKSTLMNTACGLYRPTEGKVLMNGKPLELGSTRAAIAAGMGMVHQHFMLVPPLTIAENVALGAEPRRGLVFDRQKAEKDVEALSKKLGFALDPQRLIADCSVATQQRVEILKVLYRGAKMLILDEPTAVLAPAEAEALLETVRALAGEGKSIVIISHKLREVLAVAQRVAVMRRGKLVATVEAKETSADELAALMVGGSHHAPRAEDKERPARGERIAHLRGVSARNERGLPALKGLDLELFAGEIVTVAGVDGNGQTELAEVLTGLRSIDEGTLALAPLASSREAVAHIPEDRQRRGLCLSLSVEENLALGRHRARGLVKSGPVERVDAGARAKLAEELMESLDVRPPDASLPASALSGGNQQKVIVARELLATPRLAGAARPALVVAVQPTRGLDLGAIANVHARLREARNAGAAVLVVSMDLDEVRALGDRIVVMADGRIVAELEPGADEALIGRHMLAGGDVRHG